MTTPLQDQSNLTPEQAAIAESLKKVGKRQGINGQDIDEPIPTLETVDSEKIFRGKSNNYIIFGRDRPSHPRSGTGAKGATQADRIDIIAGLASSFHREDGSYGPPNENTVVNPNFAMDAARVYISQKGDIDKYMGLAKTNHPGEAKEGASTIGLKADAIRIHSRQDIKIVTGRSRVEGAGKEGERLSDGSKNETVGTISFIAGNFNDGSKYDPSSLQMLSGIGGKMFGPGSKLQPLVKGNNLRTCLNDIVDVLSEIVSAIGTNASLIDQMNIGLSSHIHTVGPIPTTPSPVYAPVASAVGAQALGATASRAILTNKVNSLKINHLNAESGQNYINSKYVFTT